MSVCTPSAGRRDVRGFADEGVRLRGRPCDLSEGVAEHANTSDDLLRGGSVSLRRTPGTYGDPAGGKRTAPPAERRRACPDHRGLLRYRRPSAPDGRPGVAAGVRFNIRIGSSTRQERPDCLRRPARVIGVHPRARRR